MTAVGSDRSREHARRMDRMYRLQRHVYDATRKYYLFGRDAAIQGLDIPPGGSVLEIGCGTGRNLALIGRLFPQARLFGLDISTEMLISARAKLGAGSKAVLRIADATDFDPNDFGETGFDRIIISYALSMIPNWEGAIEAAIATLNPGGSLHIVDFGQQEHLPPFAKHVLQGWLKRFHVTPRGALGTVLAQRATRLGCTIEHRSIGRGYAWLFILRRPAAASAQAPHNAASA